MIVNKNFYFERTNAVWVLKLGGEEGVVGWKKVVVEGREPAPRALHSQVRWMDGWMMDGWIDG